MKAVINQKIFSGENKYCELATILNAKNIKNVFFVCGENSKKLIIYKKIEEICKNKEIEFIVFSDFEANPEYNSVVKGLRKFRENGYDAIISIGGGSAMDVAKCIKMFANMDENKSFLQQEIIQSDVLLIAIPTTAGTGSESTQFAVIYYEGEKQSVDNIIGLPDIVLLDAESLKQLPEYQRKATALDVLCHGIESYWSIKSTDQSKELAKEAIKGFFRYYQGYLNNIESENEGMLLTANLAGRAINITRTTAVHAMAYKLSKLYNIAHGHAVGICLPPLFKYISRHLEQCCDIRGEAYLQETLQEIAGFAGYDNIEEFSERLEKLIVKDLQLQITSSVSDDNLEELCKSVNMVRLKNNPVKFEEEDLKKLYIYILGLNEGNSI